MESTDYITRSELFSLLRVGRTAGYKILKQRPDFPLPFDLNGGNLRVWNRAEVLAWVAAQPRREVGAEPSHLTVTRVRAGKVVTPRRRRGSEVTER